MEEGIQTGSYICGFKHFGCVCEIGSGSHPHTQHHPICVTVNPVIVPQPTTSRRRVNLKKANWDGFLTKFDSAIEVVNSTPDIYGNYIISLTEEYKSL